MDSNLISAPPSAKESANDVTSRTDVMKVRSNSCVENKYKCTITSDRLAKLRKTVEAAIKDHKTFTIKGGWPVMRRELIKRNWVEKYEPHSNKPKLSISPTALNNGEELTINLPQKQDWESPAAYAEKCEKTIMSRMMHSIDVDFYWSSRRDQNDLVHRASTTTLMSRFGRTLFASKEGLALLLQQHSMWATEPGVASINFPRCYVLGFRDHFSHFVDDFRITACMGMLKWFVRNYEQKKPLSTHEGIVSMETLQFAMDRCEAHIETRKHLDIDKEYIKMSDQEWDEFLANFYKIMHENQQFLNDNILHLPSFYGKARNILKEANDFWPEMRIDGMRNIWILKPGNKCRGRGIQLVKKLSDIERAMGLKLKYVVQKYIENFHESYHLTNHAVQCKYTNMEQRDKALPQDNMWDCHMFQAYLHEIGYKDKWEQVIFPGMREGIVCAMLSSQEVMDRRQNTFELYGADFMIDENFVPWLLEINCSPDLSYSTSVTGRMCPRCLEDLIKVVIDKRRDHKADTGLFNLVYKQTLPRVPPYLGTNLLIRGRRMLKNRNSNHRTKSSWSPKERYDMDKKNNPLLVYKKHDRLTAEIMMNFSNLTKTGDGDDMYKGPVIEDLIENVHRHYTSKDKLNKYNPPTKTETAKKKADAKPDRVVSKADTKPCRVNNKHFLCRPKQNALKENITHDKSRVNTANWEKHTDSILKGKTIFKTSSTTDLSTNHCKFPCFTMDFNENQLPHINL